jgi:Flp pilus assembly CpaF family ATPase
LLLNPDGSLWVERLGEPRVATGDRLAPADAERIIRLVADHVGVEAHAGSPIVSAELPESGERFEGLLPPVATAPMFAIRRQAAPDLVLADYVITGVLTEPEAAYLDSAMRERRNVVIAGDAKTGKTTEAQVGPIVYRPRFPFGRPLISAASINCAHYRPAPYGQLQSPSSPFLASVETY